MQKIRLGLLALTTLFLPLLVGCVGQPQPRRTVERYLDARMDEGTAKSQALDTLSQKSRDAIISACGPTGKPVEYEIMSETILDGEAIVEALPTGASGTATNDMRTVFVLKQERKAWKIYKIGDAKGLVNLETWHPTKTPIQVATERMAQDFQAAMMKAFESQRLQEGVTGPSTETPPGQQFEAAILEMGRTGAPDARRAIDQLRKTIETKSSER